MSLSVRRFLECCCTDASEAAQAQEGGASRVELCEDLSCGGVTPSKDNILSTLRAVDIPVNVLVRPRGGDFVYSEREVQSILSSIRLCKKLGVDGVVVGALLPDGKIDVPSTRRMVEEAAGLRLTFHRAFDECADPLEALEEIMDLGFDRLLTAGHATNVDDGVFMLKELRERAAGRIVIMAGSGVRPGNIVRLEALTGIEEFHSSSHGSDGRTSREVVASMVDAL